MREYPQHIVQWSGGITSWATARIVAERHGTSNLVLLFADTLAEHPDLYRFNEQASAHLGVPITRVCDGRTPIEANRDEQYLGNSQLAPCSKVLKQKPCRDWVDEHCDPDRDAIYVGFDWSEEHRWAAVQANWAPYRVQFPLAEPPYRDKHGWIAEARRLGIAEPEMYRLGYPHNNCHGACVRAGKTQWVHTLRTFPGVFAEHEKAEAEFRTKAGNGATYLTETLGGVKRPLPLIELRARVEKASEDDPGVFDPYDWGGCGCFTEPEAPVTP